MEAACGTALIIIVVVVLYVLNRRRSLRHSKQARLEFMKNLTDDIKKEAPPTTVRSFRVDTSGANTGNETATWGIQIHMVGDTHIGDTERVAPFGAPRGINPGTGNTATPNIYTHHTTEYIIGGDFVENVEEDETHGDLD